MTLLDAIHMLRTLIAKSDEYKARYTVELQAHVEVMLNQPPNEEPYDETQVEWYRTGRREALERRDA